MDLGLPVEQERLLAVASVACFRQLGSKAPVVDGYFTSMPDQTPVLMIGPCGAPLRQHAVGIPLARLHRPQPLWRRLSEGKENVRDG